MSERPNKRKVLIYAALTVITLAAFEGLRYNDFVCYDDSLYVSENPNVIQGLTFDSFVWAFKSCKDTANWHPVTWLSHTLDCEMFGLNAHRHHLMNLLFHVANTLLLFFIFERMTGAVWRSAFVAGIFGIHPVHVESVAWMAERKDVLSGLFWMLTIIAYLNYISKGGKSRYLLIVLLFCLGLMAKSMLVTLPFVLLLLDYWPLGRLKTQNAGFKKQAAGLVCEKLPLFALSLVFCVIAFIAQRSGGAMVSIEKFPLKLRLANIFVSYVSYIGKIFYPANLAVLYPGRMDFSASKIVISFLILALISRLVVYFHRGYPEVGWFWYLGTLVPVIGLVQIGSQSIADRYLYLPLIGISVMVGWGFWELVGRKSYGRPLSGTLCAIIFAVLILLTRQQVEYWRDSITLFNHTLKVTENNSVICNNLGIVLSSQGKFEEAASNYQKAVQIEPRNTRAYCNLALVYSKLGRWNEAVETFRHAILVEPNYPDSYCGLGIIYNKLERWNEAVQACKEAIRLQPDFIDAYYNLGLAYNKLGRYSEAADAFKQSIRLSPAFADAHYNLGLAYGKLGRPDEAIEAFRQAVHFKPDFTDAYYNIGSACGNLGRWSEAAQAFKELIRIKPDDAEAHYSLARTYLMLGDSKSALNEYETLKNLNEKMADDLFKLINTQN
jgi:tetratricopeptide (TPR) repeat protein